MEQKKAKIVNLKTSAAIIFRKLKKLPWILGRHAFTIVLFFILLDLIFGAAVFYEYVYLVKTSQPQITDNSSVFKDNIYQQVIKDWQARDQKLQNFSKENKLSAF